MHGSSQQLTIDNQTQCEVEGCNIMTIPDHSTNHSRDHPQTGKRHANPQPAQKPLMLVNNQKSSHLGHGCGKDCTHRSSVSHHKL